VYPFQRNTPKFHSYTNPAVKIIINSKAAINPILEILFKKAAHGNKNVISKSKIINKIDTK
jgi:hypothetical protein